MDAILTRRLKSVKTGTHCSPIDMNVGVDGTLASQEGVGNQKDYNAGADRPHVHRKMDLTPTTVSQLYGPQRLSICHKLYEKM